jgi:hypothetical protein
LRCEASSEQRTGIAHVNTAITEMDGVTQQNAALVEEAAAAVEHARPGQLRCRRWSAVSGLPRRRWPPAARRC